MPLLLLHAIFVLLREQHNRDISSSLVHRRVVKDTDRDSFVPEERSSDVVTFATNAT